MSSFLSSTKFGRVGMTLLRSAWVILVDLKRSFRARYGHLNWSQAAKEVFVVFAVGVGVSFASLAVEVIDTWRSSDWGNDFDILTVAMADRGFLVTSTLTLAIPFERSASNMVKGSRTSAVDWFVVVYTFILIIFGLLLSVGAKRYTGFTPSQIERFDGKLLTELQRSRTLNVWLFVNLPALIVLSTLGGIVDRSKN